MEGEAAFLFVLDDHDLTIGAFLNSSAPTPIHRTQHITHLQQQQQQYQQQHLQQQ
eukprot:gene8805-1173_t